MRSFSLFLLLCAASACQRAVAPQVAPPQPQVPTVPPPVQVVPAATQATGISALIDSITSTPPLDRTHWGIEVYEPATRRVLYAQNSNKHFIPASNNKLVVTLTAMHTIGPEWHYDTQVFASFAGRDTDVFVIGSGDPTMSARYFADDFFVLRALADSIAAAGIRRIRNLSFDLSAFDDVRHHPAWELEDVISSDGPQVLPFSVGEGAFRVVITPTTFGEPATVRVIAPEGALHIQDRILTVEQGRKIDVKFHADTAILTGSIEKTAAPDTQAYSVPDPVGFTARAFTSLLKARGVRVQAWDTMTSHTFLPDRNSRRVANWSSPPVSQIISGILKPSQNWMAEQLCKTLGKVLGGTGSWSTCTGIEKTFLAQTVGIDSTAVFLRDASGLAVQNLLTPHAIVQLLDYNAQQPWGSNYRQALPLPGDTAGTLSNRLTGLRGRLQAKTGSLTNVASLSGYVTTLSGRTLIFSILTNGSGLPGSRVRQGMDKIVNALGDL